MVYLVDIRDRRQITLPAAALEQLALGVGDKLAFEIVGGKLTAKPVRQQALDTLKLIQKAFTKVSLNERELQENGQILRKKLVKEIYGRV